MLPWGKTRPGAGSALDRNDPINAGLLAFVPGFEGAGQRAREEVGGRYGSFSSTGLSWAAAPLGKAMSYDGSSNVTFTTTGGLSDATYSAWIRPSSLGGFQRLMVTGGNEWSILFNATQLATITNGNADFASPFNLGFSNGVWYHICVVKSIANSATNLYINGVKDGFTLTGATVPDPFTSIWLGSSFVGSQFYSGIQDNVRLYKRALTHNEVYRLYSEPFAGILPRRRFFPVAASGGGATHTTTGVLTGQGSTVAGTATHKTLHTTTGALSGQGATVAGTATHKTRHTTSGALSGQGASIVGVAKHPHVATGALSGQGAAVSGTATHTAPGIHATTGALAGQGAALSGTATHKTLHTTSGVLAGQGASIVGSAAHPHVTSGVLSGQGAAIIGVAEHITAGLHTTSGALVGQGSAVSGTAELIAIPRAANSTPGFRRKGRLPNQVRGETEEEKTERRIREGTIPAPVTQPIEINDVLDKFAPDLSAKQDDLGIRLKAARAEQEVLRLKIQVLEQEKGRKAKQQLLLREQEAQYAALKERLILEEMEAMDVASIAIAVLTM